VEQLSFVMHDLRTPLSAMHIAGQILEKSLAPEAKTQRVENMLDLLQRNSGRVNALLRSMLGEGRRRRHCTGTALESRLTRDWASAIGATP